MSNPALSGMKLKVSSTAVSGLTSKCTSLAKISAAPSLPPSTRLKVEHLWKHFLKVTIEALYLSNFEVSSKVEQTSTWIDSPNVLVNLLLSSPKISSFSWLYSCPISCRTVSCISTSAKVLKSWLELVFLSSPVFSWKDKDEFHTFNLEFRLTSEHFLPLPEVGKGHFLYGKL